MSQSSFADEEPRRGAGIAPDRKPINFPPDAAQAMDFNFRAQPPARLVVEVDRKAWPKAAEVLLSAHQPTLDYQTRNLKAGDTTVTFDDLPAGTFQVNLQNAARNIGGDRLAVARWFIAKRA
jgi:hypothetical protein